MFSVVIFYFFSCVLTAMCCSFNLTMRRYFLRQASYPKIKERTWIRAKRLDLTIMVFVKSELKCLEHLFKAVCKLQFFLIYKFKTYLRLFEVCLYLFGKRIYLKRFVNLKL